MGAQKDSNEVLTAEDNQFVTFIIGDEEYAIEALRVQEITGLPAITKVPYLPQCMKGVINLRGAVIPVTDLRLKFGFPEVDYTRQTCLIVVKLGKRVVGMIVDGVSEVASLPAASIDPPPEFGSSIKTEFMQGIGKLNKRMIILLDADRVFGDDDMTQLEMTA